MRQVFAITIFVRKATATMLLFVRQLHRCMLSSYKSLHASAVSWLQRCVASAKIEYEAAAALDPKSPAAKGWLSIVGYAEAHR